jgi:8-amino-7-oxononanoate synthase
MSAEARLGEGLAGLERQGLLRTRRTLQGAQAADVAVGSTPLANFSSNDYLGLANDARLREAAHRAIDAFGVGSGASPLVSGHSRLHDEAEQRFARFCGLPRALLFGSGYAANLGILASLGGSDAEIFSDELNHACLIDGARLSRAKVTRYSHLDIDELARAMGRSHATTRIVATDAVFSMDGDIAPVPRLVDLCERHDAWLVLDDAHGIGVTGNCGRGTLDHFKVSSPRVVYMATLGKALGGYGAFVAGPVALVEWVMQRARTYIFSTALPPMAAAVAIRALELLEEDPSLVARLHERISQFRRRCAELGIPVRDSSTAIHPIILRDAATAVAVSKALAERGLWVPAIRPPSVPEGTSRLRISLSAAHGARQVDALTSALADCLHA